MQRIRNNKHSIMWLSVFIQAQQRHCEWSWPGRNVVWGAGPQCASDSFFYFGELCKYLTSD